MRIKKKFKLDSTSKKPPGGRCVAIALLSLLGLAAANAQVVFETVWIPMKDVGSFGEKNIKLEATLYKPPGTGQFPIVLFNHGSSGGPIPASYTETSKAFGAYLLGKGIALIVPMRRGRGKSEGDNLEEPSPCTLDAAKEGLKYAFASVDATFDHLRQQPWVAMDKVVLAGHSRGGILAVEYAARNPGASIGVINFSGGWKNDNCGPTDLNLDLFREAGATSKVPNLFLYGRGDAFYSVESMKNYSESFNVRGGDVESKLFDVEKINGHQLFHRALSLWSGSVALFLERLKMSSTLKSK